jgi:proline iminopeptidase
MTTRAEPGTSSESGQPDRAVRTRQYVQVTSGMLVAGAGHRVWWRSVGDPSALPVVVLHGGPGSGSSPWYERWFDPMVHRLVLFDQRNCGRSTPHAGDAEVDLSSNSTPALIGDIEQLREMLGVERWLVAGTSWGTTLGLAYAQAHPDRVLGMVLNSVGTTSRAEVEWLTRGMGRYFAEEWQRFVDVLPEEERDGNLPAAYNRLLMSSDPSVHGPAAAAWCSWEATHVATDGRAPSDPRYDDARFRLCFARLVTHFWMNFGFLPEGQIMDQLPVLSKIPAVLVHGRRDLSSPLSVAEDIQGSWPGSRLIVVDDAGHGTTLEATRQAVDLVTSAVRSL